MLRVIGGELRGRRVAAPKGRDTRPTSDRVREAIFDILGDAPGGARVLDLYAGSGALAIEALSRGAQRAVLVEQSVRAARIIEANLAALGLADKAVVVRADAVRFLDKGPSTRPSTGPFDLIFADPPYTIGAASGGEVLASIAKGGWLAPSALVVVEHDPKAPWDEGAGLALLTRRTYGGTAVSIYGQEGEPSHRR